MVRKFFVQFLAEVQMAVEAMKEGARQKAAQVQAEVERAEALRAQAEQEAKDNKEREFWANADLVTRVAYGLPVPLALSVEDSQVYDQRLKHREQMQYCQSMGALGDAISNGEVNDFDRQERIRTVLVRRLLMHGYLPEVVAAEAGWTVREVTDYKEKHRL